MTPRISIIIPTLNEELTLADTLSSIPKTGEIEIIVVDGGSIDRTREIATAGGAIVHSSRRGRAWQMNIGAARASGGILLFLHADCILPQGFAGAIQENLKDESIIAGAFKLRLEPASPTIRLIQFFTNVRSSFFSLPYGDQALFLLRDTFIELGGFPEIPLLEDYVFVRALRRWRKIQILDIPITSSSRRWTRRGVWRTTLLNFWILLCYKLGVSPASLARMYYGKHISTGYSSPEESNFA